MRTHFSRAAAVLFLATATSLTGTSLYISNETSGQVNFYDLTTGVQQGTIGTYNHPVGLALDSAGNLYVTAFGEGRIYKIDTTTGTQSVFITRPVAEGVFALAFDAAGYAYVTSRDGGLVSKYSPTGTFMGSVGVPWARGIAYSPVTGTLYVVSTSFSDGHTGTTDAIVQVTPGLAVTTFATTHLASPRYPAVDSAGNVLVSNGAGGSIESFRSSGTYIGAVVSAVNGGNQMTLTGGGYPLYVTQFFANSVLKCTAAETCSTFITQGDGIGINGILIGPTLMGLCDYRVAPQSSRFGPAAGSGSFTVTTTASCAWSATTDSPWLQITSGNTGVGNGTVSFTVPANTGASRTASIAVGDRSFRTGFLVTQEGPGCSASLQPASISIGPQGGTATLNLAMTSEDCRWNIANLPSFITTTTTSGIGSNNNLILNIQPNATGTSRSASISIAGIAVPVEQSANCSAISIAESSQSFPASGGLGSVLVSAPAGCSYQVSSSSDFVQVPPPAARTGPGSVTFTVQANSGARPRIATLTLAGLPFQILQAADNTPSITCAASASPVILRALGRTEQLGDLNLICSGRTGGRAFSGDVLVVLNVAATNRMNAATGALDARLTIQGGGTIAGRLEGVNAIRFPGVPFSSGDATASLSIRIFNIRGDVSQLGTGGLQLPEVTGTVSVIAPLPVPVLDGRQLLGNTRSAMSFSQKAGQPGGIVPVVFLEGFANAFKTLDAEAAGGTADTATRLVLRVSRIPLGVQLYAPITSINNAARLVSADSDGFGGSPVTGTARAGALYAPVTVSNTGTATITWEIVAASANEIDGPEFRILLDNATSADVDQVRFEALLGPLSDNGTASATVPIPRFLDPTRPISRVNLRVSGLVSRSSRPASGSDLSTCPNCVGYGSVAALSYSVKNDSDQRADDVVLRITLPEGLSTPIVCNPTTCEIQDRQIRFRFGSLGSAEARTATVSAVVGGVGNCPNCVGNGTVLEAGAGVSSTQSDADLSDNQTASQVEVAEDTCRFTLSKSVVPVGPGASTFRLDVTTGPGCEWTPPPAPSGVTISPASALRGSATLQLSVPANPGATSRTIAIGVQGETLQIVQTASGCTVSLTPPPGLLSATGGDFTIGIQANCEWRAAVSPDWLRIGSEVSGTGNGTLRLSALANGLLTPRLGLVEVSGQQVVVTQAANTSGCTFSLSSNAATIVAGGGSGTVIVTTQAGCPWTATASATWIAVTASATSFAYTVAANSGGQRVGNISAGGQTFSITQSAVSGPQVGLRFVAMTPCRVLETRPEYNYQGRTGAFGPPFLQAGETRTLVMANSSVCQIPASAKAYVLNATLVPRGGVDFVTIFPAGETRPTFWTVRSPDGQIVANSAIVKAGSGAIQVYTSSATDVVLDISGYYTDDSAVSNQAFYPLTPCRVVDTRLEYRAPAGPFGPPTMTAGQTRRFQFPSTPYCTIPAGASAYSVTITVVPQGALQFLTAWPAGGAQPNISQINSPAGRILANSAILPASADGSVDVFVYDRTDVLIDINGYFGPDNGGGLFYFPVPQCRASDSRDTNGTFGGPIYGGEPGRTLPIPASACSGVPANAKAYAVNVTALPNGSPMPFVTAWPTGQARPNASVLNAFQGQVVTNLAIVPAGGNGAIDVFAFTPTHVVVEVSGYFGR